MQKSLRIVNDTNVWLSALYFSGKPAQIVHLVEEKNLISVVSQPILNELKEKMTIDFQTPAYAVNGTISYIKSLSEFVSVQGKDFGLRDKTDNVILETAVVGACNFPITGDKDLLVLNKYNNLAILNPSQFLDQYNKHA